MGALVYGPLDVPMQVPQVDWLDKLSLPFMSRILADLSRPQAEWPSPHCASEAEEKMMASNAFLVVSLPMFQFPVLYEEKAYPGVGLPPLFHLPRSALEEKGEGG